MGHLRNAARRLRGEGIDGIESIGARANLENLEPQTDTWRNIMTWEAALKPGCETRKIVNTEVVDPPPRGGGAWKERWTLDRCGVLVEYEVKFTPHPGGGTLINIPFPPK